MPIETLNPATGETQKIFDPLTKEQIEACISKAAAAYTAHRLTSFRERAEKMRRAGEILIERKRELGELMTTEMGKPVKAGIAEAEKCASA
ncbi:MAG TPA: aldehyde dehydrogenase family protein, partial [Gemmatimonadaceae bacterium]|nr:aldehyde dehydrogenase family protein [Gemmatimonadaceae bacterium]